jgi:hypothetical protein
MSDFQVLKAVRGYLLNEEVAARVHLTLPPKAIYPLVLVELEEIWSPYPLKGSQKRKAIQARVKFKASIFSHSPAMEEAALLSHKVREALEGASLWLPEAYSGNRSATIRFLSCVTELSEKSSGGQRTNIIHHFYDAIIRG